MIPLLDSEDGGDRIYVVNHCYVPRHGPAVYTPVTALGIDGPQSRGFAVGMLVVAYTSSQRRSRERGTEC